MVGVALAASAAAPTAASAGELFAHGELSLRRGPGPKFSVVTTVGPAQRITVLWCNASANWCLVDDGLMQGWAPIDSLRRNPAAAAATDGAPSGNGAPAAEGPVAPAVTQASSGAAIGVSVGGDGVAAAAGAASVKLP